MKKNLFVTIYAICVSLIFLGTIVFSGFSLYTKNSKGYVESKKTYDNMAAELRNAFQNPSSPNMNEKINHAIGSYDKYSFISIKVNGNTVFLYPGDTDQPSENSKFSKLYFQSYKIGDLNLYIQANVYTLSPATISYYAKISFIIILIFTLLTIVLIFVISNEEKDSVDSDINISDNNEINEDEITEEESEKTEYDIEESEIENNPAEEKIETEQEEFETFPSDEIAITTDEDLTEETPEENEDEKTEDKLQIEAEEPSKEENIEKIQLPVEDFKPLETSPSGLYSPLTGFGWESYLKPRLENELSRASASEFDVVLFLIKIEEFETLSEETVRKTCEYLTNIFQFKDLIFEYKNNCFAAIKTNTNIDEAIPLADKIYTELSELIDNRKCFIGISSKTIRLVGAERVLKEADAALEHAIEDPENPIIAFRADAEKYMDFIENN